MEISHDTSKQVAWTVIDGHRAQVEYEITEGTLDILHTFVPQQLEGRGIASQLVQFVYDYAVEKGLKPAATCSYARAWLMRHPNLK